MLNPYSAVIVGLGIHGQEIAALMARKGIDIVGAADPRHAGADLGELLNVNSLNGITVVSAADDLEWTPGTDIAVITAKLDVASFEDLTIRLLGRGVDVITIIEDLFDIEYSAPATRDRIHQAALAAGKSVVVTGAQDTHWSALVLAASALVEDLTAIRIKQHLGVDGYPEEFLRWCGIGIRRDEFEQVAREAATTPSVFGAVLPVIASKLGLTVTNETREMSEFTVSESLYSETFQRDIPAGEPAGRTDTVTLHTREGIQLSAELTTSAVMEKDDFDAALEGTPEVRFSHSIMPSNIAVNAALVNRITDVIAAPSGLVSSVDLALPRYRHTVTREGGRS